MNNNCTNNNNNNNNDTRLKPIKYKHNRNNSENLNN